MFVGESNILLKVVLKPFHQIWLIIPILFSFQYLISKKSQYKMNI